MTVTEILDAARDLYNATGDTFFTDTQMYNWVKQGSNILARKAYVIEGLSTSTTTVASTQSYAYPTNAFAIKRVLYNGRKLRRIDMRSDDSVTLSNASSTQTGDSVYYYDWNKTLYLRPIPSSAVTLTVYSYNLQPTVTAGTTLGLPEEFHFDLVEYMLWLMFAKDKDVQNAQMHKGEWDRAVNEAISYQRRRKRQDGFATVLDEDSIPSTVLGEV